MDQNPDNDMEVGGYVSEGVGGDSIFMANDGVTGSSFFHP